MSDNDRVEYCGIADAHGIESFKEKGSVTNQDVFMMQMRAGLNRQRHAVYYEVSLKPMIAKAVMDFLNGEQNEYIGLKGVKHTKYAYALLWLKDKDTAPMYGVAAHGCSAEQLQSSWEMIPNPELDPWGRDYSDSEE